MDPATISLAVAAKYALGAVVGAVSGAAASVGGVAAAIPALGFGSSGVAAGSVAAGIHSMIGNVAAGSLFASLQSAGVLGLATGTKAALVTAGAVAGGTAAVAAVPAIGAGVAALSTTGAASSAAASIGTAAAGLAAGTKAALAAAGAAGAAAFGTGGGVVASSTAASAATGIVGLTSGAKIALGTAGAVALGTAGVVAATPRSTPGSTPGAAPGSTPGATPKSTPGATPKSTPGSTPGSTPRSTPGSKSSEDKCVQTDSYLNTEVPVEIFIEDFSKLLALGTNLHAKIKCGEHCIEADNIVLCFRCSHAIFKAMLKSDMQGQAGILQDQDTDVSSYLKDFVRYLYTGAVPELMTFDEAKVLYEAGYKFAVKSLMLRCSEYLQDNLSPENVFQCFVLADAHSDQKLKTSVINYILKERVYLQDEYWLPFYNSYPEVALQVYRMSHKNKRR